VCIRIRVSGQSGNRTGTLALPFCHIRLKSPKPNPDNRYPKELKTLGDHLRKRRLDKGLLQNDLARLLGVDKTTVTNWENDLFSRIPVHSYGRGVIWLLPPAQVI
jgi:DNA-binding XRE family transcriptional regulator